MTRAIVVGMAVLSVGAAVACVDPKSDYNQWIIRTNPTRGPGPTPEDDASFEAGLPDGGFTQLYLMACVSQLTEQDITKATYFVASATYTPSATGAGGSLDFTDTAMNYNATNLTQTATGATVATETGVPVAADGTASINFGAVVIPPPANPLQSGEVDFSQLTLTFQIGPGTDLCANLSGAYGSPVMEALIPGQNICIYAPMANMTAPFPTLSQSMVHCP